MVETFYIKRGDRLPVFSATLLAPSGAPIDLTAAASVKLLTDFGTDVVVEVDDPEAGTVRYEWAEGDLDDVVPGLYDAEFEIDWGAAGMQTVPNDSYFKIAVGKDLG